MLEKRISYNVSINVQEDREEEWVNWMQHEHLPEVMATNLFLEVRFFKMPATEEGLSTTYIAQYLLESEVHMKQYLERHANVLREKTTERFGQALLAFRTQMELLLEIKK